MLDKLRGIESRYEELNQLLIEVGDDYQRAAELNKERIDLELVNRRRNTASRWLAWRKLTPADAEDEELRLLAKPKRRSGAVLTS
jgi:hypothetical protein